MRHREGDVSLQGKGKRTFNLKEKRSNNVIHLSRERLEEISFLKVANLFTSQHIQDCKMYKEINL